MRQNERVACWMDDPQQYLQTGWPPCKIPLNPSKDRDGIERTKSKSKSKNVFFFTFQATEVSWNHDLI